MIPVFYNENMNVNIKFSSPSPGKPAQVVQQWLQKYKNDIVITDFTPIQYTDFYLAHDKNHVNDILSLQKSNGLRTTHAQLAESLVWTTGSFVQAAKHALEHGIAVSPTSGFHHANYNHCHGYCTFNGLMVAAQTLLRNDKAQKIGILDCDFHYGDGTQNIIDTLHLGVDIVHITGSRDYEYDDITFMEILPNLLENFKSCDILFYQAGADAHKDDPLGGFLSSEQMRIRDKMVFEYTKENNIPIVWNLAGGYQEEKLKDGSKSIQKVLDLHNATMEECIKVYK